MQFSDSEEDIGQKEQKVEVKVEKVEEKSGNPLSDIADLSSSSLDVKEMKESILSQALEIDMIQKKEMQ